jgi:glutamate/tyrosine decarboxylase-like PLP-dependent enzyme
MPDPLAPPADEFRAMGLAALESMACYYAGLPARPTLVPTTSAALRELLERPLPESGAPFPELLAELESVIFRYSRHNGHPRFFGYVSSPGTPVATIGAMFEAALNVNASSWRSAPSATEIERIVVNWIKEMLGFPADAAGLLVSGGSMANFAGLAAARSARAPCDVARRGLSGGPPMCVYVSEECHFSVAKAAAMLGIGEDYVRQVRTNEQLEIDLIDLERQVRRDRAAGSLPFCVVASAGTTATGAIDPIAEVAAFARAQNLWLHVDAAYGGFAALAPAVRRQFRGIEEADSVALDPHKWLYLPVGCGCVLYRDPQAARAAFSHAADYTRPIGLEQDEAYAFWDYGPELSRPFRALQVWLLLRYAGTARLAAAIERNIACARYFESMVAASPDFEMLAPVTLSVFCFRYKPAGAGLCEQELNDLNSRILVEIQRSGRVYLSNAMIRGKFALRGCVLNYRTAESDLDPVLLEARRAAHRLQTGS